MSNICLFNFGSKPFVLPDTLKKKPSEDPDEMPHNATFHQGLHCFPK